MAANPEFKIRFVGLTDAKHTEDFLTHTTIFNRAEPQLTAEVYAYTLTAQQTIERFLNTIGIEKAELILARYSLSYMGGNTFLKILEDGLSAMPTQGKMIVHNFLAKHPGFEIFNGIPLLNRNGMMDADSEPWKKNVKAIMNGDFWKEKISLIKFVQVLNEIEQHLAKLPEFDEAYFAKKSEILSKKTLVDATKKVLLGQNTLSREVSWVRTRLEGLFNDAIHKLGARRIAELSTGKLEILKKFLVKHADEIATVKHSFDSILLEKK